MAYCKIHPIRATVSGAINYITAPQKTDRNCLVSAYECSPETAPELFAFALSKTSRSDPNKAFHLIQSFLPGEVSPETAHEIGKALADELLAGGHSYVIATHIDKDHVHNHIIFCAADNINHRKFYDHKKSYRRIRNISDKICEEHGLSVIGKPQYKAKSYKEWKEEKNGTSWKAQVRKDINSAIKSSLDYDDFIRKLKEQGYQIKGEDLNASSPKYISFLPPGKERWVRGRAATLGPEYTRDRIAERITEKSQTKSAESLLEENTRLITLSEETLKNKPYLKQWANRKNLQAASDIYTQIKRAGYSSLEDALEHLATAKQQSKDAHTLAADLDKKMRPMAQIIRYAEQYQANLPYKQRYEKSKDPEKYFQRHETEISLCDGAAYMLKKNGFDPDKIDLASLKSGYAEMNEQKQHAMKEYNALSNDVRKLEKLTDTLERYLERDAKDRARTKGNETLS